MTIIAQVVAMKVCLVLGTCSVFISTSTLGLCFLLGHTRAQQPGGWVRVVDLDSISDDGHPHLFRIVTAERDAWTRMSGCTLAHVYLRRVPNSDEVVAVWPLTRFGVFVEYDVDAQVFREHCWETRYSIAGKGLTEGFTGQEYDLPVLAVKVQHRAVFVPVKDDRTRLHPSLPHASERHNCDQTGKVVLNTNTAPPAVLSRWVDFLRSTSRRH